MAKNFLGTEWTNTVCYNINKMFGINKMSPNPLKTICLYKL